MKQSKIPDHVVSVIVPTWNNPDQLMGTVRSMLRTQGPEGLFHIFVINNGEKENADCVRGGHGVTVVDMPDNVGWEGGLIEGLKLSDSPYVLFLNDDVHFIQSEFSWLLSLLDCMKDPTVGAVGPSSNAVMGSQNVFIDIPWIQAPVMFLIGFCMLVRREALERAGGIDRSLPGGDDIDLSIRLRKEGYALISARNVFVYHHGFQSGVRRYGNYYNSFDMTERTNFALIRKHGLTEWFYTMNGQPVEQQSYWESKKGKEEDIVAAYVTGKKVVDLGCGATKTVKGAVGVDMVPFGHEIVTLGGKVKSVADVIADVSQPLPFRDGEFDTAIARHVLEHVIGTRKVLAEWSRIVKKGGRIIIAVPDHRLRNTIPLNVEHVIAFTPENLTDLAESIGLKTVETVDTNNGISFIGIFEKL